MGLGHGGFGTVEDIVNQLGSVGQGNILAIDVLDSFLIDQEEMLPAGTSSDVDVFAQFDIAVGASDE